MASSHQAGVSTVNNEYDTTMVTEKEKNPPKNAIPTVVEENVMNFSNDVLTTKNIMNTMKSTVEYLFSCRMIYR